MIALILVAAIGAALQSDAAKPLPELAPFLQEVRKHLRSDRLLLSQYTYVEKNVEKQLDDKGNVKKTDTEIYEVYPSLEEGQTYSRLVEKNGKPVPAGEIEKQDRQHDKKVRERVRKLEREGVSERDKRLAKEAEEKRKEEETIDELF